MKCLSAFIVVFIQVVLQYDYKIYIIIIINIYISYSILSILFIHQCQPFS